MNIQYLFLRKRFATINIVYGSIVLMLQHARITLFLTISIYWYKFITKCPVRCPPMYSTSEIMKLRYIWQNVRAIWCTCCSCIGRNLFTIPFYCKESWSFTTVSAYLITAIESNVNIALWFCNSSYCYTVGYINITMALFSGHLHVLLPDVGTLRYYECWYEFSGQCRKFNYIMRPLRYFCYIWSLFY